MPRALRSGRRAAIALTYSVWLICIGCSADEGPRSAPVDASAQGARGAERDGGSRDFTDVVDSAMVGGDSGQDAATAADASAAMLGASAEAPAVTDAGSSAIASAASGLGAGQSVGFDTPGLTQSLLNTLQWENRFFYDHRHGVARLLGKNASSQGSQRSHAEYDVNGHTWMFAIYGGSELGHVYESQAYDWATTEIYTGTWSDGTLKKWRIDTPLDVWVDPATSDFGVPIDTSTQPMLGWHPNLFGPGDAGILALHDMGTTSVVVAWRKTTNTWSTLEVTSHSLHGTGYLSYGVIEYVRGGDYAIAAFDPSAGGKTFRIEAGSHGSLGSVTEIEAVPVRCGYTGDGGDVGILIDDPSGGAEPYILEKGGANRVWRFTGNSWSLRPYTHPFPTGAPSTETSWCAASCYPLGVFWSIRNRADASSMLWRPND